MYHRVLDVGMVAHCYSVVEIIASCFSIIYFYSSQSIVLVDMEIVIFSSLLETCGHSCHIHIDLKIFVGTSL